MFLFVIKNLDNIVVLVNRNYDDSLTVRYLNMKMLMIIKFNVELHMV